MSIKKKIFSVMAGVMMLAVVGTPIFLPAPNVAEARSDYYVGYDSDRHANLYIDTDSIRSRGYSNFGAGWYGRRSEAEVHWSDGRNWPNPWSAAYDPNTGNYYFTSGTGGWSPATGILWNFAYYCDLFAYGG